MRKVNSRFLSPEPIELSELETVGVSKLRQCAVNMGVPGMGAGEEGGGSPPQFVGQTRPVGQYLLQSRANDCYTLTLV